MTTDLSTASPPAEPPVVTMGLIMDVLDVLERAGFHMADTGHTGRAVHLIHDLAKVYSGAGES